MNNVAVTPTVIPSGGNGGGGNGGRIPHRPTLPPSPHSPSVVAVNTMPLTGSEIASSSFVFRKDSAGLGVPRETLGNLHKFSNESISHGTARIPIYASVPESGRLGSGASTSSALMGASIHRGYAPAPSFSQGSSSSYSGGSSGSFGSSGGGARSSGSSMPSAPAPSAPSGGGARK